MTASLAHIWRYPIKSHGREALDQVSLTAGSTMPWDRVWAVAHEASKADGTGWAPCANFSRGAKASKLMAIDARLDEQSERVTLTHPERPPLTVHPEHDIAAFLEWVAPLMPAERAQSARIVRVPGRGMTDSEFPSISIANLASHGAVAKQLGHDISPIRWRANLWVEGPEPWSEFELIGKTLSVGDVRLEVREPITRCLATTANPETGERDADTLGALDHWNHQEFGIYATVLQGGKIALGDTVTVL